MIQYQSENFGKSYSYRSRPHESWSVAAHIHEFCELAFTKSGCQTVYVDGIKYPVPEKCAILILPNQIHEYTDESESVMRCAVFSQDFVPLLFQKMAGHKPRNPVVDFGECFELLTELENTQPDDLLKLGGLLGLICDHFLKSSDLVPNTDTDNTVCHNVIGYISQNFKEDITLKEIAIKLGYNEKYISSSLHTLTKMNFRTFLSSYRIELAKHLLTEDMPITDIALECGYRSINTFNRTFKQITGTTPSHYREEYRKAL